jgi:fibronectin-binding autotransporter adhesin
LEYFLNGAFLPRGQSVLLPPSQPLFLSKILQKAALLAGVALLGAGVASGQTAYTWNGTVDSDWANASNWDGVGVAETNGEFDARLNVYGGQTLIFTSALGDTTYNPSGSSDPTFGRGLVMGGTSSLDIQSGRFTADGGQASIVAVNAGTSALTISGGEFTAGNLLVGFGSGGTGIVNLNGGSMTASAITLGTSGGENGRINLNEGTLSVNGFSFGSGTGNTRLVLNGGTLRARTNNASFINSVVDQLLVGSGGAVIDTNGFNITIVKGMTPDGQSAGGLTKRGAGTLTLSGTNSYDGATAVEAGTLFVTTAGSLPGFDSAGRVSVAANAMLAVGNSFSDADIASLASAATFASGSAFGFDTAAGNRTFAGGLSGAVGLAKIGGNTLTLSGVNSYSGATSIAAGMLLVSDPNALGNTSGVAVTSTTDFGGGLQLADGITVAGKTITISGTGTNVRGSLQAAENAAATWAGDVVLGGGAGNLDARVGAMAGGTLTISGQIRDGTQTGLVISGENAAGVAPGRVIVAGANNGYSGSTQIVRGILALGADNALPIGTLLDVHSAGGVSDAAWFDLSGHSQEVAGLRRGSTSGPALVTNSAPTLGTLTVNSTDSFTFDSPIGGNLALTKTGSGRQTLSGTNTFTGQTTVLGGTLRVASAGSLPGFDAAGRVLVGAGGTLAVLNGFVDGDVSSLLAAGSFASGSALGFDTAAGNRTFAGGLSGQAQVVKLGGNTLTLASANSHSGGTAVASGILSLTNGGGLGTGPVAVTAGARIELSGNVTVANTGLATVAGDGGNFFGAIRSVSGDNTWAGSIQMEPAARLGAAAGATLRVSGPITGTDLTLRGTNAETARIELSGSGSSFSTLRIVLATLGLAGGDDRLPTSATVQFDDAGRLDLGGFSQSLVGISSPLATLRLVGNSSTTSDSVLTITGSSTFGGRLVDRLGSGTRTLGLTKSGAGTLVISGGSNTFSGPTRLDGGTLELGNALAVQNSTVDTRSGPAGSLSFGTQTAATFGGLTGSNDLVLQNASSAAVALTVGGNGESTSFGGILSGAGSLTKAGLGSLTLSGSNSYAGDTAINSGTLVAGHANAFGTTGSVTIGNGAVLGIGNDVVFERPLTIPGTGRVSAGDNASVVLPSVAALAAWESLSPAISGTLADILYGDSLDATARTLASSWTANPGTYLSDILSLSGTGADTTFVLSMSYAGSAAPEDLNIWYRATGSDPFAPLGTSFEGTGPWSAAFTTVGQYGVDTAAGSVWVVTDRNSDFTVIAVPEPAALVLVGLALGAVGLGAASRRRRLAATE